MNKRTLRFGTLVGLVGGSLMALFAMGTMKLLGNGFFTPVNLFAHTFWGDAPTNGMFTVAAFELGLLIHLTISVSIGMVVAYLVDKGELDTVMVCLLALGAGATAWIVQAFAWTAIDAEAHAAFTPWVLAVAHVIFAAGAAGFLLWLQRREASADVQVAQRPDASTSSPHTSPRATRSGWVRPSVQLGED